MGINDLLPHLPGGRRGDYLHSFYGLDTQGKDVALDAAGALWQFAAAHAPDFLSGNHIPALVEWAHFLNYLRSICRWKLRVYFDGRENPHKGPEIERRKHLVEMARARNDPRGQVKNTAEYIAMAMRMCQHLSIEASVSAYEADPQVTHEALSNGALPVTGDSDLLAYQEQRGDEEVMAGMPDLDVLIVVQSYKHQHYRIIDLRANVEEGEYPLFDLYRMHGKIVFQLYAACRGCDFTENRNGIPDVGYKTFMDLAVKVEGEMSAATLAEQMWTEKEGIAQAAGFESLVAVEAYMQNIVDVYTKHGRVYDKDSNVTDMTGRVIESATDSTRRHMAGKVHSGKGTEFERSVWAEISSLKCEQLIHRTAADATTIRGVQLPNGKSVDDCTVSELRDFIAARGGKLQGTKNELVRKVNWYRFKEKEVSVTYVDRNPDPNGSLYMKINTSSTRPVGDILGDLALRSNAFSDTGLRDLIRETQQYYSQGLFEDKYDNIARVAPEMKEGFIYKEFGHIGASIREKNISDALRRCWYDNSTSYHGLAFVPDSDDRVIILSKAHASMARDEKTRNLTEEGEAPQKKEYLLMMELLYHKSDEMADGHGLGIFVELGRTYCTACVAGEGACRHKSERLWYQYHHWTDERFGIEKPSTLEVCSWAPGGKALNCDVRQKIHQQQSVKLIGSIKEQTKKIQRGQRRDCTEGNSCDYQLYPCASKQQATPLRFAAKRFDKIFTLLREQE